MTYCCKKTKQMYLPAGDTSVFGAKIDIIFYFCKKK